MALTASTLVLGSSDNSFGFFPPLPSNKFHVCFGALVETRSDKVIANVEHPSE
ncbi:hypothetical protein CCACVL1_02981 [Corchorus capsularis]|uniref:Uncharacterized protein n=1 Tax=Corchorus capsularis TaxID=210143 RepID=A0A1R3K496_COCAP|nr:hypothetical protein CCACVL1_02981 [Corchorus capsularis]